MSSDSDQLLKMRGMSDPHFFAFNVLKDKTRMLCHAVILSSFEIPSGSQSQMSIGQIMDDARGRAFIKFVMENYFAETQKSLQKQLKNIESDLANKRKTLSDLERKIKSIKP